MQFQTNPFLIWQLIPAVITAWLALRIHRTHTRKPELIYLEILLFAASFWSLVSALQYLNPGIAWQVFWHRTSFLAIFIIPTAWFLLSVHYSRYLLVFTRRMQSLLVLIPLLSMLALLSNGSHHLFFSASSIVSTNGFSLLIQTPGILFIIHTWYSYGLVGLGMVLMIMTLFRKFKKMGIQAMGLAFGITVPAVANFLYLSGYFPPGFPDPTPISFAITGIILAGVLFSSRMLEVVPIAYKTIVSDLTLGILVLDLENRVLEVNQAASIVLGFDQTDPFNKPLEELLEYDPILLQNLQNILERDPETDQRASIVPCGGTQTFEVYISGIKDEHGDYQGKVLQISDISQQLQVEKNLNDSQILMNDILDTLQDYYFETDVQGNLLNINKSFYTHLGYSSKDDLVGKNFRHFTTRKTMRSVYENFKKLYETRESLTLYRYQYHTKDGKSFIGETTLSPIFEGNEVVGARGVLRNITDQVVAEENLLLAKEEAESRVNDLIAINRIASISTSSLDLDNILHSLCIELTSMFPVRNACINLADTDRSSLKVAAFHSVESEDTGKLGSTLTLEEFSARDEAITKGHTVLFSKLPNKGQFSPLEEGTPDLGRVTTIIVPIKTRNGTSGTIDMAVWDSGRVFTQNEITLAETIAYQVASAIDNAQLYEKTENALDVVEQDMEIGRQVQTGFFPQSIPDVPGWEFAAHFEPSRQVAGDFYDFFKFKNSNMLAVVIADVCDKGVGAALFMVLFRSLLRAFSRVEVNEDNVDKQLKRIISRTNDYIAEIHVDSAMFATMFMGILDPDSGTLYYINAGHESPVILNQEGRIVQNLQPTGPAVGVIPQADFKVEKITLQLGDFLMGYTDGTTDAYSEGGEIFTKERLLNYIQYPWSSLFSMVFEVKCELHRFAGSHQQFDDITIISMRRKLQQDQEKQSICRESRLEYLDELGEFVEASLLHCKSQPEQAIMLRTAAEHACRYIVRNGYQETDSGVLSIFCEQNGKNARLIIRDDGKFISSSPDAAASQIDEYSSRDVWKNVLKASTPVQVVSYEPMNGSGNQLILEMELDSGEIPEPDPEGMLSTW